MKFDLVNAYYFRAIPTYYSVAPYSKATKLPSHLLPPGFIDEGILVTMDVPTSEVGLTTGPVTECDAIEIARSDDELRTPGEWTALALSIKVRCRLPIPAVTG